MRRDLKCRYHSCLKNPLVVLLCLANSYVLTVLTLLSRTYPEVLNVTAWLYDDQYVVENSLRYYVDFRPGYPPIGKIPIYLIYSYAGGGNLAVMLYNIFTFNISILIFYYLIKRLTRSETSTLKAVVLYALNPATIVALLQPHADFLALSFTLMSILFLLKGRVRIAALSIALGFLTKTYPLFILIPAIIVACSRARVALVIVFITAVWLISIPFLILDPLMYLSTFIHHLYRGPSESIFAVLDGYYGHTGFVHPLFDAAIYYFQFAIVYQPSHDQHFYYAWRNPSLKYFALLLQLVSLLPLCLYALRSRIKKDPISIEVALNLSILAFFTFLSLSPTQNILTHIPAYTLACALLIPNRSRSSIVTLLIYVLVNGLHAVCWTLFYQHVEFVLFTILNLRLLIVTLVYFSVLSHLRGYHL